MFILIAYLRYVLTCMKGQIVFNKRKLRKNYLFHSSRFLASFSYSVVFPSILKPSRQKLSVPALFIVISEDILSRLQGIVACKRSNRRYNLSSVDIAYSKVESSTSVSFLLLLQQQNLVLRFFTWISASRQCHVLFPSFLWLKPTGHCRESSKLRKQFCLAMIWCILFSHIRWSVTSRVLYQSKCVSCVQQISFFHFYCFNRTH